MDLRPKLCGAQIVQIENLLRLTVYDLRACIAAVVKGVC